MIDTSETGEEGLEEEKVSSEKVFSGLLLHVYRDEVRLPDHKPAVREWIDHPGAAAVVPVFEDNTTLLIEQYRYPVQQVMLEVPAGKRDGSEPFLETAQRELEEETGWSAAKMEHIGFSYPVIGYSNEVIHLYLATELTRGTAEAEEDEFLRIHRIPFKDAWEMVRDGVIVDMKSIIAIERVNRLLGN